MELPRRPNTPFRIVGWVPSPGGGSSSQRLAWPPPTVAYESASMARCGNTHNDFGHLTGAQHVRISEDCDAHAGGVD